MYCRCDRTGFQRSGDGRHWTAELRSAARDLSASDLCGDAGSETIGGCGRLDVGTRVRDANGERGGIKESVRWIESHERVAEQAGTLPETRMVYVTDREGDIAALMQRAEELGHPARAEQL